MNIAEPSILFGGLVSLCVAAAISYLGPRLGWLRFDHGRGPQRIHYGHTPRVGGIAVFSGCCVAFLVFSPPLLGAFMLVCAFPVFLIGVAEDLTNRVSALVRLLISILSAVLLAVGLDVVITDTGFQAFDSILQIQVLAVALSICAITAHCHAVNIIDGLNGLAAGSCVAALAAVAFLAARYGDTQLCMVAMGFLAPTAGFLLLNYPRGLLFLGDGGAYLLGAVVAALVIILPTRNPEVSSFASLLIVSYPIYETIRSYVRRSFSRTLASMQPDDRHLHSRVFKLVSLRMEGPAYARNAAASACILLFSMMSCGAAVLFHGRVDILMAILVLKIVAYEIVMHEVKKRL